MLSSFLYSKSNFYKKNNSTEIFINHKNTILGGCVPTTLTNSFNFNNKYFKNMVYFSTTNSNITENKPKMLKKVYYKASKKRKFIPIAYNNHSTFLLKYFFKQFVKGQYNFLFKSTLTNDKKKRYFFIPIT